MILRAKLQKPIFLWILSLLWLAACAPAGGVQPDAELSQADAEIGVSPIITSAAQIMEIAYVTDEYRFGESESFWASWDHWKAPEGAGERESELSIYYKATGYEEFLSGFDYRMGSNAQWRSAVGDSVKIALEQVNEDAIEIRFMVGNTPVTEQIVLGAPEEFFVAPREAASLIWELAKEEFAGKEIGTTRFLLGYARLDPYMARWQLSAVYEGVRAAIYSMTDVGGEYILEKDVGMVPDGAGGYRLPEPAAE